MGRPHIDENGQRRDLKDTLEYIETEAEMAERESRYERRTLGPAPVLRHEVQSREET